MNEANTPLISNTSSTATTQTTAKSNGPALRLLPSSTSTRGTGDADAGCLRVAVLSAYDLAVRDPPSYVSITVGNTTVCTGPPVQRHKDRNAFKFVTAATNGNNASSGGPIAPNHQVTILAPLQELFPATAIIKLVYTNQPTQTLTTEYKLNQLVIHEKTWLILHLDPNPVVETASDGAKGGEDSLEEDEDMGPPTLRLQMTLEGPYRPEIATLIHLGNAWFTLVDSVEYNAKQILSKLPHVPLPDAKFFLIPAAPFLAVTVVSLPVVLGILILGLPMFLPLAVVLGSILAALAVAGLSLYGSTSGGRSQLQAMLSPAIHTLLSTRSGQRLIYQTGPRPTPVSVARIIVPEGMWAKLWVSLLIDMCGSATYLLPIVGEGFDIAWAPFQTVLLMAMYEKTSSKLKYLSFIEEILPLTDIVPSATLGWLMEFAYPVFVRNLGLQQIVEKDGSAGGGKGGIPSLRSMVRAVKRS